MDTLDRASYTQVKYLPIPTRLVVTLKQAKTTNKLKSLLKPLIYQVNQ